MLLQVLSGLELRWANLREGARTLSEREAHETTQAVYDWWIKSYRDNPSDQVHWATEIGAQKGQAAKGDRREPKGKQ